MGGVRVLVATSKGAFLLTSDEQREKRTVDGPHFAGREPFLIVGAMAGG